MFAVVVTITVKKGQWDAFLPAMMENARASRMEPACRKFDVCSDPSRPDEVFLYELYEDEAGFEAHHHMPHYRTFSEAVGPMIKDKQVRTYAEVAT